MTRRTRRHPISSLGPERRHVEPRSAAKSAAKALRGLAARGHTRWAVPNHLDPRALARLLASARDDDVKTFMSQAWAWLASQLRFDGGTVITSFARRQSYVDIQTHGIDDLPALMASYEPVRHLDGMGAKLLAQAGQAMIFAARDTENLDEAHRPLREHLLRFGLEFGVGLAVAGAEGEWVTVILLYRASPETAFSEAERSCLDAIGPLLAELVAQSRVLNLLRDPRTGMGELAVAVVDGDGKFVQTTPAFVRSYWGNVPPRSPYIPAEALAALRRGEIWPTSDNKQVLQAHTDASRNLLLRLRAISTADLLSTREREIARLFAAGQSHTQIARRLHLAPSTVRNHVAHCYEKLGVNNRVGLLEALAQAHFALAALDGLRGQSRAALRARIGVGIAGRRQLSRRQELRLGLHALSQKDCRIELAKASFAVPHERMFVVLGHFENEMGEPAHARQVLQLLQHERAHTPTVIVRVHGKLLHVERAHLFALEIAWIKPGVFAHDLEGALRVSHDLLVDQEQELLDPLFFVGLEKALLGTRSLVLDGRAVHIAKRKLQEVPHRIQIATVNASHLQHARLLGFASKLRLRLVDGRSARGQAHGLRSEKPQLLGRRLVSARAGHGSAMLAKSRLRLATVLGRTPAVIVGQKAAASSALDRARPRSSAHGVRARAIVAAPCSTPGTDAVPRRWRSC